MRFAPTQIFLVSSENVIDHLIENVLSGFADEVCVRVERLVSLMIEARSVPHELLAARPWLDQCHAAGPP